MSSLTWKRPDGYVITTDPHKININELHRFLSLESYWALGVPKKLVEKSLKHSISFSLLSPEGSFIGFARVITDQATFAYLADVFVHKSIRMKGLGTWLMETVIAHPDLQNLRNFLLFTKDAQDFYAKFGWTAPKDPSRVMVIKKRAEDLY